MHVQSADQSSTQTMQDGGHHVSMDVYVQELLTQLMRGEPQARNCIASDLLTGSSIIDNTQQGFGALPTSHVKSAP